MNNSKFYHDQEVQPEELTTALLDSQWDLLRRMGVLLRPGIVPASKLYIDTGDARWNSLGELTVSFVSSGVISVSSGMAFIASPVSNSSSGEPYDTRNSIDYRMQRVFISPSDALTYDSTSGLTNSVNRVDSLGNAIPTSTGHLYIPVPNGTTYVYIKHLLCADTSTVKEGAPANNFTVNTSTGAVSYIHWVDGYQIYTSSTALTDSSYLLLATVALDGSGNLISLTNTTERCGVNASLVRGDLAANSTELASAKASAYVAGSSIKISEHINAVGDLDSVTATNPHGTTIADIPGLAEKFGIFATSPSDFYTPGIVDVSNTAPGPFWPTISSPATDTAVLVTLPSIERQALYLGAYGYDKDASFFDSSAAYDGTDDNLTSSGSSYASATFSGSPAAGYYVIFASRAYSGSSSGLAIRYLKVTGTLADIVENPMARLTAANPSLTIDTAMPLAIVNWAGAGFSAMVDPQVDTVTATASYYVLDVRHFGTVSERNITHDRRCHTSTSTPITSTLVRSNTIYSDVVKWICQGPAVITTGHPVVQTMVKKAGRITRVMVFSDTIPSTSALTVNIKRNGVTIFTTEPSIAAGATPNAADYTGATNAYMLQATGEVQAGVTGQIDTAANRVYAGDRLQMWITSAGAVASPGGNDLLVTICIE